MAVDKQEFAVGTVFTGRYKKVAYRLTVVETADGPRYELADGQRFKSLSAAGSKIMGGKAVNGWRFWTLEGAQPEATAPASEPELSDGAEAPKARTVRVLKMSVRG